MIPSSQTFPQVAKTMFGLEDILAEELQQLGASTIEKGNRAVTYQGDNKLLYKANLHLRTALRILVPVAKFSASDEATLYNNIKGMPWETLFSVDDTFAIDATAFSKYFTHTKYLALKTKDAIADRFREKTGKRPDVELDFPDFRINIHVQHDQCTVSLDSSGESLHKRGYRSGGHLAPINEVLAAGLILQSGWDGSTNFVDPMCGSGTIVIEAGLIATNKPANGLRKQFGFTQWPNFDKDLWKRIKDEAESKQKISTIEIVGSDKSSVNIQIANHNIESAGLQNVVSTDMRPILRSRPPEAPGTVLINPPYGERLEDPEILSLYSSIGDTLKKKFSGYQAWIISSNKDALKNIGLRTSKKMTVFNGSLECKFQCYDLYEGSKKAKSTDQV